MSGPQAAPTLPLCGYLHPPMAIALRSADVTTHPARDRPRALIGRHRASWWLAAAGAVLGLVVVVCLAAAAYGVIRTAEIRNDLVDRLYPAETENLRLTAALVDEETGIRGYAATGDRSFLAPYTAGRAEETRALSRLATLAGETPEDESLPSDLGIVRTRARDWRTQYAEPVIAEVRRNPGMPTVTNRADDGKVLFDAVRGALARQGAGILAARTQGRERLADAVRNLVIALIVIGVALVLAAIAFALVLRRAISDPLARLSGDVRRVARGEFATSSRAAARRDIVELGGDVESMRRRIVAELAAVERGPRCASRSRRASCSARTPSSSSSPTSPRTTCRSRCARSRASPSCSQQRYDGQLDERADQYIDVRRRRRQAHAGAHQRPARLLARRARRAPSTRSSTSTTSLRRRARQPRDGDRGDRRERRASTRCRRCAASRSLLAAAVPEPDRQRASSSAATAAAASSRVERAPRRTTDWVVQRAGQRHRHRAASTPSGSS